MRILRAALAASVALLAALGSGAGQQRHANDPDPEQRVTASAQQPAPPEQSCKCDPKRVGQCFAVHGRLSRYRNAPTARISIIGTRRVLGLRDGVPEWLEEDLEVPGNAVIGDFVVCPFTRRTAGVIQLVCIDSASNMAVTQKP